MERELIKLEKSIRSKMLGIKLGSYTPKDSGIATKLNLMKKFDEPLYDSLIINYKEVLSKI